MNFPDLLHLRQLQIDLWRWPKSRASLMVGAGLSLNSDPLPGVHTKFPTWRELVWAMFQELYPSSFEEGAEEIQNRQLRANSINPLRLASEYEAAFGRRKLDQLIKRENPDINHQPGNLHRMLMELPWADVFTTNYDTLLERTSVSIRSYQPVINASELTTAFSPRIIKLHGSFPSQTPYVITEDDYRTYPAKFAPFVNSVQQSLIENSFVLIGFSGDDPNFLAWSGWIRDNLGENHSPIYLVGPLNMGDADKALLMRRGVTPIDLFPLFSERNIAGGIHYASIKWFLQCLAEARPDRPEKWPENKSLPIDDTPGFPDIIRSQVFVPENVDISPLSVENLSFEIVLKILLRWQYERTTYPGWVVLTDEKRKELWGNTRLWIIPLAAFSKEWNVTDKLLLFREINWRVETAMVPLFPDSIKPFTSAVEDFFVNLENGLIYNNYQRSEFFRKSSIQDMLDSWFEISFGLLREAREIYNEDRWNEIKKKIDKVVLNYPQYLDRYYYESALWSMWRMERYEAKATLKKWEPSVINPLASIWKASLAAELDELGEAKLLLRSALVEIRKALNNQGQNIELLSLEGWCTFLIFVIEQGIDFNARPALQNEFSERWHELKALDCDPWALKEYFDEALKSTKPKFIENVTRVRGFDPGHVTISNQWISDEMNDFLPAFACIRFFEQVGIPMWMSGTSIAKSALITSCTWLSPFLGFGSLAVFVRSGQVDDLNKTSFMSRTQIALTQIEDVNRLHDLCAKILKRESIVTHQRSEDRVAQKKLFQVLPQILSRLSFRVDVARLQESFELAVLLYSQFGIANTFYHRDTVDNWFRRLYLAAEVGNIIEWVPILLKMPLYEKNDSINQGLDPWPDAMVSFPTKRVCVIKEIPDGIRKEIDAGFEWLMHRMASDAGHAHRTAQNRIFVLYEAGLLNPRQVDEVASFLWNNKGSTGLPDRSDLMASAFLLLPAPQDQNVGKIVKSYILDLTQTNSVIKNEGGKLSITTPWPFEKTIVESAMASAAIFSLPGEENGVVEWSCDEARILYKRALQWWDNDKVAFDIANKAHFLGSFALRPIEKTLLYFDQFLTKVVIPNIDEFTSGEIDDLMSLVDDLRQGECYVNVFLVHLLIRNKKDAESVEQRLLKDFSSNNESAIHSVANAVRYWVHLAEKNLIPEAPISLVSTLIYKIAFRDRVGIFGCFANLELLIIECPEILSRSDFNLICASLLPWYRVLQLDSSDDSLNEFDNEDKPSFRTSIGKLAGALKIWHEISLPLEDEPQILNIWKDNCLKDSLPEVKRSFYNWMEYQKLGK